MIYNIIQLHTTYSSTYDDVKEPHTNRKLRGCTIRCFDDNYKNFNYRGRQKLNKSRLLKNRSAEGLRKSRGRKARKDFLGFLSDWVVVGTSCCQHAGELSDDFAVTVVFRWRGYKVSLCIYQAFTNMWYSYAYNSELEFVFSVNGT